MNTLLNRIGNVWQPHPGQRAFLDNDAHFRVLACGRRWGKTDACAADILLALSRGSPTKHLIIAPTLGQARILFDRVIQMLEQADLGTTIQVKRSGYPILEFGPHVVLARSGHNANALRGHTATHIYIDEAAFVPEPVITEVALPMLATTQGRITLISTPHGRNHFWRFYQMGQDGQHGIWSRRSPSSESPHVSETFLAIQREIINPRAFQVEYEAEFNEVANRIFKSADVEACLVAELDPDSKGPVTIGVDWARDHDYTAVAVVQGHRRQASLIAMEQFHLAPWQTLVARVVEIIQRFPRAIVSCDATGVGSVTTELLESQCRNLTVKEFKFNKRSKRNLIGNLACMFEMGWLKLLPHTELIRQLTHFDASLNAESGHHDDLVIALGLAVSELITPYSPSLLVGARRAFGGQIT